MDNPRISFERLPLFSTLSRAFTLIKPSIERFVALRLLGSLGLVVLGTAVTTLIPVLFSALIDALSDGKHTTHVALALSLPYALLIAYVVAHFSSRLLGELRATLFGKADARLARSMSRRLLLHVLHLPLDYHLKNKSGTTNQTLVQGLSGYRILLQTALFTFLPVIVQVVLVASILWGLQPLFLLVLLVSCLAYVGIFLNGTQKISDATRSLSGSQVATHGILTDCLLNIETIKNFTNEHYAATMYDRSLGLAESSWSHLYRHRLLNNLLLSIVFCLSLGTANWIAVSQYLEGNLSIGELVLINTYLIQIIAPLEQLGHSFRGLTEGIAYLERMLSIFDRAVEGEQAPATQRSIDEEPNQNSSQPASIEFDQIQFAYDLHQPILKHLNFQLVGGKSLAVVGASGSGKSTIIRLLLRLYSPQSGDIRIGGESIYGMPIRELRSKIAVIPQDTMMFNDSLATNIGFGDPDAPMNDIIWAAKQARIHETIQSLPEQYDTVVGERGLRLSGGERQRIAIARAILKKPSVFVFDEATSSLDVKTEQRIQENLWQISQNTTTIIVAHRLSTIVNADHILVLDNGEIVEQGSHRELLAKEGPYYELWACQNEPANIQL
ncbi:ATP-binding cassette domain-containing protein [Porticoccus sp. GXU_MW_L64]